MNSSYDDSSCCSFDDETVSVAVTPFNKLRRRRTRIITSVVSQIFANRLLSSTKGSTVTHPQRPPLASYHASIHQFNGSSDAPPDNVIAAPPIIASYHASVHQFDCNSSPNTSPDDVIAAPPIIAPFLDSVTVGSYTSS